MPVVETVLTLKDITILIALASLIVAVTTMFLKVRKSNQLEGKDKGTILTKLEYMEEGYKNGLNHLEKTVTKGLDDCKAEIKAIQTQTGLDMRIIHDGHIELSASVKCIEERVDALERKVEKLHGAPA